MTQVTAMTHQRGLIPLKSELGLCLLQNPVRIPQQLCFVKEDKTHSEQRGTLGVVKTEQIKEKILIH